MDASKELIEELRRVAMDLTRDTNLYFAANLMRTAANRLEYDKAIIQHFYEVNGNEMPNM